MAKRNFLLTDNVLDAVSDFPADRSAVLRTAIQEAQEQPIRLINAMQARLSRPIQAEPPKKRTVTVSISEKTLQALYDLNSLLGLTTEHTLSLAFEAYFTSHGAKNPDTRNQHGPVGHLQCDAAR